MTKLVFFGSAPFSTIVLEKLLNAKCLILSVVTKPDKPVGRHLQLTPNPVKVLAQKSNIPVLETINDQRMTMNDDCMTIGLVAAYGQIIPQEILNKFNGRIYNIHPSLLPKYRGPSPLQQQILDGISETGVTIIQLDEKMDHGPVVTQEKDVIYPDDTWTTLGNRLFAKGANLFLKIQGSGLKVQDQDHSQATYTKKLTRADGFITWEEFNNQLSTNNSRLGRLWRAFHPWPGVWTTDASRKRIKLIKLSPPTVQYEGQNPQLWSKPSD